MASGAAMPARTAILIGVAVCGVHLAANAGYGFFRDELYFIVCGRHPALGYVDQPPLVPLLAAASQAAGVSLFALRAVPACAAGVAAWAAAAMAVELGGGAAASWLAGLCTALAPVLATFGVLLGPDSMLVALWTVAALCVTRALQRDPRWWLGAGLALGLAGEAKYTTLMFDVALLAALAATAPACLRQPRFWAGLGVAALLVLPNGLWQLAHGLPMLELLRNGQNGKNVVLSPSAFLVQQLVLCHPLLAPLWIAGLVASVVSAPLRWLAAAFLLLMAMMLLLHGKAYYPAAIYPSLFAAGAAAVSRRRWLAPGLCAWALLVGVPVLPLSMPVLSEARQARYAGWLARHGIGAAPTEHHREAALGQVFADMHGWPALAGQVAVVYAALSPDQRAGTAIVADNYGEAAAIDVLAPQGAALPPVLSGHNQYWLWGPRGFAGPNVIDVGGDLEQDRALCADARVVARTDAPWAMPYEDGLPIVLCKGLRQPLATLWPRMKAFH